MLQREFGRDGDIVVKHETCKSFYIEGGQSTFTKLDIHRDDRESTCLLMFSAEVGSGIGKSIVGLDHRWVGPWLRDW